MAANLIFRAEVKLEFGAFTGNIRTSNSDYIYLYELTCTAICSILQIHHILTLEVLYISEEAQ